MSLAITAINYAIKWATPAIVKPTEVHLSRLYHKLREQECQPELYALYKYLTSAAFDAALSAQRSNLELRFLCSAVLAEPEEPKTSLGPEIALVVQNFPGNTTRSTLDKLKSLLPIPKFLTPLINMFLGKGTNAHVKVSLEKGSLILKTAVNMPAQGIQGIAVLRLPVTAQAANDAVTELHPNIIDKLKQALKPLFSEGKQVKEIIKLISTHKALKFTWLNGFAEIILTLPNGASLILNLVLSSSKNSETTPDILRTFLKSILKNKNYAGIETLLNQDMIFYWDGLTSRFEIRFRQQLALHIKEISSIDISNWFLRDLVTKIGNNSMIIIPQNIRGTIDFKNPSIQFDPETTFIVKNAPVPDITIDRISYDPDTEKMFLTLKTSVIPDALLENIEIDMKDSPKKPLILDCAFVPVKTEDVIHPKTQAVVTHKPTISVFESLKQMIKIPKALEPLIAVFFADQTKLDVNLGIEDDLIVSVESFNIPKLGITCKAFLKIPTKPQKDKKPITLSREIEEIIDKLGGERLQPKSMEESALFCNLFHLALTIPNQNIRMQWEGDISKTTLFITLPGGMELTLELDVKEIQAEHDTLRTKLLEALDSQLKKEEGESEQSLLNNKLLDILYTFGKHDPRRAKVLTILDLSADKELLRAEFVKMPETDLLRTKLSEILGDLFANIEPFLSQTMNLEWDGEKKNAVLKLPNLGATIQANIFSLGAPVAAEENKKTVELYLQIIESLAKLISPDSRPDSADLIDLILTMSNQDLVIRCTGDNKKAFPGSPSCYSPPEGKQLYLSFSLGAGQHLRLTLDIQNIEEGNDILCTKLAEIFGAEFVADIEPLLAQNFIFIWDGKTKHFALTFLKEQDLHIKSMKFKRTSGFFGPLINPFMGICEWFTNDRMITLPKKIRGDIDIANASISFCEGTSFLIHTALGAKLAELQLVSFARENMIDIRFNCYGERIISFDRTTSNVEETRIAIVEKDPT